MTNEKPWGPAELQREIDEHAARVLQAVGRLHVCPEYEGLKEGRDCRRTKRFAATGARLKTRGFRTFSVKFAPNGEAPALLPKWYRKRRDPC